MTGEVESCDSKACRDELSAHHTDMQLRPRGKAVTQVRSDKAEETPDP